MKTIYNNENRVHNQSRNVVYPFYVGPEHSDTKEIGGMTFAQCEELYKDHKTIISMLDKEIYNGKIYSTKELVVGNWGDNNPVLIKYTPFYKERMSPTYSMSEYDAKEVWNYLSKKVINR